jgi:hypothetical protein
VKKLLFILFIFACQSIPTYPWFSGELEELKKMAGSKPIMMEFYTDS